MCQQSRCDFSDLKTLFLNCTRKKSPEFFHTQSLIDILKALMERVA